MSSENTERLLEELLVWTKFGQRSAFKTALASLLVDRAAYEAYEASDGSRTQAEVAALAGVTQPTVSRNWAKWSRLGVVRIVDGRAQHLQSPSDLGIPRPD